MRNSFILHVEILFQWVLVYHYIHLHPLLLVISLYLSFIIGIHSISHVSSISPVSDSIGSLPNQDPFIPTPLNKPTDTLYHTQPTINHFTFDSTEIKVTRDNYNCLLITNNTFNPLKIISLINQFQIKISSSCFQSQFF